MAQMQISMLEEVFLKEVLPKKLSVRREVPLPELIPGARRKFRLDFVVVHRGRTIVFEIDGARHHFRDPQQIERDGEKDRLCRKHGIAVHRFLPDLVLRRSACKRLVKKFIYAQSSLAMPHRGRKE